MILMFFFQKYPPPNAADPPPKQLNETHKHYVDGRYLAPVGISVKYIRYHLTGILLHMPVCVCVLPSRKNLRVDSARHPCWIHRTGYVFLCTIQPSQSLHVICWGSPPHAQLGILQNDHQSHAGSKLYLCKWWWPVANCQMLTFLPASWSPAGTSWSDRMHHWMYRCMD